MLMVAMVTWNAPKRKDERDKKGLKEKRKGERERERQRKRERMREMTPICLQVNIFV